MRNLTKDSIIWPDLYVYQKKSGYRFSMDSVILSRLLKSRKNDSILEIGSGAGVVLLIIAKLNPFKRLVGVEIQKDLFELSKKNLKLNKQEKRIELIKGDIKTISKKIKSKFDIILSNPPYYPIGSGRLNKNQEELIARHEFKLDLKKLIRSAKNLLTSQGELNLIYSASRSAELISCMRDNQIEPKLLIPIYSTTCSEADLIWVRGVHNARSGLKILTPLFYYDKFKKPTKQMQYFYSRRRLL